MRTTTNIHHVHKYEVDIVHDEHRFVLSMRDEDRLSGDAHVYISNLAELRQLKNAIIRAEHKYLNGNTNA